MYVDGLITTLTRRLFRRFTRWAIAVALPIACVLGMAFLFCVKSQENLPSGSGGLYLILDQKGKFGFINKTGYVCITPQFEVAWRF
jgi:hypothetical protein